MRVRWKKKGTVSGSERSVKKAGKKAGVTREKLD